MLRAPALIAICLIVASVAPPRAQAAVVFEIARLSDKVARITGSGSFDSPSSDNGILFLSAVSDGGNGLVFLRGSMTAGAATVTDALIAGSPSSFLLRFDQDVQAGAAPSGRIRARILTASDWAAIGSRGDVVDRAGGLGLGSYRIVEGVPLPAPGLMLLGALAALGLARRRRTAGQTSRVSP